MNDERRAVIREAAAVVAEQNWVTFDTETTSLRGQIIQWAVCAPSGTILGEGLVKPTEMISQEAQRVHGLTQQMLRGAPAFPEVCEEICSLLTGKTVVIYNADFDTNRLLTTFAAHAGRIPRVEEYRRWLLHELDTRCAMEWFAVIYGEWSDYHERYTYQSLSTACHYFGIPFPTTHLAREDAQATAQVVRRMAALAKEQGG